MNSSPIKDKARSLREKGFSFRQIANKLGFSLSTIHFWTKDVCLSDEQKKFIQDRQKLAFQKGRLQAHVVKKQKKIEHVQKIRMYASQDFLKLKERKDFLVGLSLYWAEGFKKDHSLGFVNSDPEMVRIFLSWLLRYGKIKRENIRVRVQINEIYKTNISRIEKKWSEALHIPQAQFQKPFFQKSRTKHLVDDQYIGLLRIRAVESTDFFITLLNWIEELKNQLKE